MASAHLGFWRAVLSDNPAQHSGFDVDVSAGEHLSPPNHKLCWAINWRLQRLIVLRDARIYSMESDPSRTTHLDLSVRLVDFEPHEDELFLQREGDEVNEEEAELR